MVILFLHTVIQNQDHCGVVQFQNVNMPSSPQRNMRRESRDNDLDEQWFCLKFTEPFICRTCDDVHEYLSANHEILIWPSREDFNLKKAMNELVEQNIKATVVEFVEDMGSHVTFYAWRNRKR